MQILHVGRLSICLNRALRHTMGCNGCPERSVPCPAGSLQAGSVGFHVVALLVFAHTLYLVLHGGKVNGSGLLSVPAGVCQPLLHLPVLSICPGWHLHLAGPFALPEGARSRCRYTGQDVPIGSPGAASWCLGLLASLQLCQQLFLASHPVPDIAQPLAGSLLGACPF